MNTTLSIGLGLAKDGSLIILSRLLHMGGKMVFAGR